MLLHTVLDHTAYHTVLGHTTYHTVLDHTANHTVLGHTVLLAPVGPSSRAGVNTQPFCGRVSKLAHLSP